MSSSLLRKSLELVESEYILNFSGQSKETKVRILNPNKKNKHQRGTADVQRRNLTSVDQAKRKLKKKQEKAISYLEKLEKLRKPVVNEKVAKLILDYTRKPGVKDQEVIFLKEEPKSVFTEEDFARFAAEYVDDD